MATQAEINEIATKESAVLAQLRPLAAKVEELENTISKFEKIIQRGTSAQARGETLSANGQAQFDEANAQLATLQSELAEAQSQLGPLRTEQGQLATQRVELTRQLEPPPQPAPPVTASQAAQEDGPQGPTKTPVQEVGADGRVVTAPPVTPATNATPTETTATNAESNTDPATVPLTQSQATTPQLQSSEPLKAPAAGASAEGTEGESQARAQLTAGTGAPGDDAANNSTQAKQSAVNAEFNAAVKITPKDNVLDKFSSYTYQASVYLMSPIQYEQLLNSKKKTVNGYQLLFQSGGAPNNVGGPNGGNTGAADAGRNPFFDNDFYIDSIVMDSALPGRQTGAAHMVTNLKFTVIEPASMTLIDNLYAAVKDIAPKDATGAVNYSAATYLMVIRFFGYDESGKLVTPGAAPGADGVSNPTSVVEKFVPFLIKKINWGVGNKLVQYDFECAPVGQLIGSSTARGTIPYDIELTASTVGKVLKGNAKFGTGTSASAAPGASTTASSKSGPLSGAAFNNSAAPQKANAAPTDKKTITGGLMDAMNEFQKELVQRGIYSIPDEYELEFVSNDPALKASLIEEATIVLSDNKKVDKSRLPISGPPTVEGGKSLDPGRQASDLAQRSLSITAGQQLVQVIELAIRNSSYIYNQSLLITKPDGSQIPNPEARNKPMSWFLIAMSATPIGTKIDPLRNDYAYKVKYTVTPFRVPNFDSKYFPTTQFPGLHKQYNYWFTGQNNAVLDYQAQFNSLYNVTVSGSTPEDSNSQQIRQKFTSSMRDIPRYVYAARSNESGAGGPGKSNEVSANAAEYLYSPGDLHTAKVKIIGDPAWIQQGSLFRPISDLSGQSATPGFEPDGTINFDNSQVLFEIAWQRPEDYNLATGIADPYAKTSAKYKERQPLQSNVYQATRVTSEFKQGKFEQTINGSLYFFPKPDGTNAAVGNAQKAAATVAAPAATATSSPNQTAATQLRTGVDLSNGSAGGGRGNGQIQLLDNKVKSSITSVTGTTPTSSAAQGVQQILNPPKVLSDPTLTQLTSSQAYIVARRSGQTPEAALQTARNSFAATSGGSAVSSNGLPVATNTQTSPPTAGNNARLTPQQIEQLAASQNNPQQITREY